MKHNSLSQPNFNYSGIMPLMCQALMQAIAQDDKHANTTVTVTYIEICREQIRDLLSDNSSRGAPQGRTQASPCIREVENDESGEKEIYVENVVHRKCESIQDVLGAIAQGSANRSEKTTGMNERSSRSHAVLVLELERFDTVDGSNDSAAEDAPRIRSKVHLVDLAGSERTKATGAVGE
jgi:hypothetical protein